MTNPHDVLRAVVARGVAEGAEVLVEIAPGSPSAFFFEHAGYSTPPGRQACALQLAEAEQWARDAGVRFVWVDDWKTNHQQAFPDAYDQEPETCEGCTAYLGADVVASLWCIDDATDEYRRVIEAELAQEARDLILSDLAKL